MNQKVLYIAIYYKSYKGVSCLLGQGIISELELISIGTTICNEINVLCAGSVSNNQSLGCIMSNLCF